MGEVSTYFEELWGLIVPCKSMAQNFFFLIFSAMLLFLTAYYLAVFMIVLLFLKSLNRDRMAIKKNSIVVAKNMNLINNKK